MSLKSICNVCLDDKEYNEYSCLNMKCYTCKEGFVCSSCIPTYDPSGTPYLCDIEEVKKVLKCPCCQTLNWKYHYSQIISLLNGTIMKDLPIPTLFERCSFWVSVVNRE